MERTRWLAETQDGPISRPQLLACGFSPAKISRLLKSEWLIKLFHGVYALAQTSLTERGRLVAPLLYAGPGSALSHETAAYHLKLIERQSPKVHVSCLGKRRSQPGLALHRPKSFESESWNGLPCTTLAQTLVDIAPGCPDWELRKALANAQFGRRLTAESMASVTGKGHPGSAKLNRAIQKHMPELAKTLSPLEDMLLFLCEKHGVPLPAPNKRIGKWRPDGVWPDAKLIVELDGGANHSSPTQRRVDAERDMYYRSLGYLVLRYTYWQVRRQGQAIAAELKATLASRSSLTSLRRGGR